MIEIPIDIDALIRTNIEEARAWQAAHPRLNFKRVLTDKLVVTGFAHNEKSAHYLLEAYEN